MSNLRADLPIYKRVEFLTSKKDWQLAAFSTLSDMGFFSDVENFLQVDPDGTRKLYGVSAVGKIENVDGTIQMLSELGVVEIKDM